MKYDNDEYFLHILELFFFNSLDGMFWFNS